MTASPARRRRPAPPTRTSTACTTQTAPDVEIVDVTKRFGDVTAVDAHEPAHRARRVLLAPRAVGLRQDHDAADDRRLRAADRGRDPARRRADRRRPAVPPQRQHGLPALRAVPAHERRPERRLRPAPAEGRQGRRGAPGRRGARARPPRAATSGAGPGSCRAASSSASRSPGRSSTARRCCSSTSRSGALDLQAPQGDAARAQGSSSARSGSRSCT